MKILILNWKTVVKYPCKKSNNLMNKNAIIQYFFKKLKINKI